MIFWKRHWLHGLQQKGKQMFNQEHLSQIDKQYFNIHRDMILVINYYDSVESVRQSRALSERNRPGLFS